MIFWQKIAKITKKFKIFENFRISFFVWNRFRMVLTVFSNENIDFEKFVIIKIFSGIIAAFRKIKRIYEKWSADRFLSRACLHDGLNISQKYFKNVGKNHYFKT